MADASAGKPFGKYTLVSELGRGGMGVVYRAFDRELQRDVALKMLISGGKASEEELERFRREARAAAALKHPNIIGIHEIGVLGGRTYFSMEYVKGTTLESAAAKMSMRQFLACISTVAKALHFAHERSVIHRDVKPSNILIAEDGHPCLMDFGLAKKMEDTKNLTQSGVLMGTPNYVSPEQALGEVSKIDGRSDVFSLGIVLYWGLTQELPFSRTNIVNTMMALLNDPPAPPRRHRPDVPADVETICLKALEKSPSSRYATAGAMADDLDRFLAGQPILARPPSASERASRWIRRHAAALALGSVVLVSVAGGLVAWRKASTAGEETRHRAELDKERADLAARASKAGDALTAGRDQMAIAERCLTTGRAEDLQKSLRAAIAQFDLALAADDSLAEAWAERGRARRLLGDTDGAAADLGRAIERDPKLAVAWYERGKILVERFVDRLSAAAMERRGSGASANALKARELQTAAADDLAKAAALPTAAGREWISLHARGALAFLAGDAPAALKDLDAALAGNPFLDDALDLRAWLHLTARDLPAARADLDRAIQTNAFNANAIHRRGVVRFEAGDLPGALEDYDRALSLEPRMWRARLNRGRARLAAGKEAEAIDDFTAAVDAEPDNLLALEDRAEARLTQKDSAGAEADLTLALALAPDASWLLLRRAAARRLAGNFDAALADADAAAKDPASADEAAKERGRIEEARGR